MSKTPTYALIAPHHVKCRSDYIVLSEGTFVRPLSLEYVPQHVLEDRNNLYVDKTKEVFCYTRYGIVPIPRDIIKEV